MKHFKQGLIWLLLLALAVAMIAPFIWMVLVSVREPHEPIPTLQNIIPHQARWENYRFVLMHPDLPVSRFFINSVIVAAVVVFGQLLVTSMCAYGLVRMRFRHKDLLFTLIMGSMMFGGTVTQIPVYLLFKELGWLNTYAALIVPSLSSSFTIFLLRQFFQQIPLELDEAAKLDGASDWMIYTRIIMPMSKAALATAGAFTFFGVWTDFFSPMIFTNTTDMRTLEVGLSVFKNSYQSTDWPLQMTAAVIVLVPSLVIFLLTQRSFTKGVSLGSFR